MNKVLWTALGVVVAVNVVVLVGAAISLIVERRRHRTEIRYLEAIWRGERPVIPGTSQAAATRFPHRASGRRLAGVVTTVALLCAGTALASPDAREAVVSVLGTVAEGLQLGSSEPATSGAGLDRAVSLDPTSRTSDPAGAPSAASGAVSRLPEPSAGVTEPTTPGPIPGDVPATPTTISAVQGSSGAVALSWNDVVGETGYRVERSGDGMNGWQTIATVGVDVTSSGNTELTAGTYYYRVFASGTGGDSPPSDVASVTVVDPPSPPTVTAEAVSAREIHLSWLNVANEAGYQIERSDDGATGWIEIATTGQGVTEYSDAGLAAGTRYYYRVVAVNAAGGSSPSDVASAETHTDQASPSATDPVAP